jgi:hypothetical protein
MGTRLTIIGAIIFAIGILYLVLSLRRIIKRIGYRDTGEPMHLPPKNPRVSFIVFALVLIILSQAFFWLSSQITYFRPIGDSAQIGKLEVERLNDPVKSLRMTYLPLWSDSTALPNQFYLSGDSWKFSGEIIKFKIGNKYLDLPARAYKIKQFDSRFIERLPPNASGALLDCNVLEGGGSTAFRLFRDSRYFKWFADVDSFSIDYVTTAKIDSFTIKLESDRTVGLIRGI